MASVHVLRLALRSGAVRYRVRYRLGGRESQHRHGGSFHTRREAEARARFIAGELAARRIPDVESLEEVARARPTVADTAERWLASRLDHSANTAKTYRQAFRRLGPLGAREPGAIAVADVQEWIAGLVGDGLRPSTVRKYLDALRAVLDFAELEPNPARSRRLSLPRSAEEEVSPPMRGGDVGPPRRPRAPLPPARAAAGRDRACAWASWRRSPGATSTVRGGACGWRAGAPRAALRAGGGSPSPTPCRRPWRRAGRPRTATRPRRCCPAGATTAFATP